MIKDINLAVELAIDCDHPEKRGEIDVKNRMF